MMASQSSDNSVEEVSCTGESRIQHTHGNPDSYTNNGTGRTSDFALNNPEGPNAHLQPGDIQSFFSPNFCPTYAGSFYHGSDVAYGSNPMIQAQTMEAPPVPLASPDQSTAESISVNPKQYNAIVRRRNHRKMLESQGNLISIRKREINRTRQSVANQRPRGEDGRFISMNQYLFESFSGGPYNSFQQIGSSVEPTSSSYGCISTAKKIEPRRIILLPKNSDKSGATTYTGTQCWQANSNIQNTSSTPFMALLPSDLAVLPPPTAESVLEFPFLTNTSDIINLDDIDFDMTGMSGEPMADAAGSSTAVAQEMVLPTILRDRLHALKEYLIQNPAETFIRDVSIVQDILSGIVNTELPTDIYLAICEVVSLIDMGDEYDAAKERQKKRENLMGLTHRLLDSKAIVASSFWRFQEEQKRLTEHKLSKSILQQKIVALEDELKKTKSQLVHVSSSIIKQMGWLKKLQDVGQKEKENAQALEAELNEQTIMLGDAQADEELLSRPARVLEAAKQKLDIILLDEN